MSNGEINKLASKLSYVAEDSNGNIVGYILGKMSEEKEDVTLNGHVTSLGVVARYRKLGMLSISECLFFD